MLFFCKTKQLSEKNTSVKPPLGFYCMCLRLFLSLLFFFPTSLPDFIPYLCSLFYFTSLSISSSTSLLIPQPSFLTSFFPLLPYTSIFIWISHNAGFSVWQKLAGTLLGTFPQIPQQPEWKGTDQPAPSGLQWNPFRIWKGFSGLCLCSE